MDQWKIRNQDEINVQRINKEPSPDLTSDDFDQTIAPLTCENRLTPEQIAFLQNRWLKQTLWWQKRAKEDKAKYFWYTGLALVLSALITALSGINLANFEGFMDDHSNALMRTVISIFILFFSLIVTILTGLEKLYQYHQTYLRKRRYAELLKITGWQFLQLTGEYKGKSHQSAYPDFAERVENLIKDEIEGYVKIFDEKRQATPELDRDK